MTIRRGANLPYFDNQSVIMSPFPHEPKRTVLRAYPEPARIQFKETEPDSGLFSLRVQTPLYQVSLTKGFVRKIIISPSG